MENNEDRKIEIGKNTLKDLNSIRKWTMFLSLMGFILIIAFLITGLFTGIFLSVFKTGNGDAGFPEWLSFVAIITLTLILLFPVLFLFRFSKYMSEAVKARDEQKIQKAFRNLKKCCVLTGILVILFLALYLFIIIYFSLLRQVNPWNL